MSSTSRSAWRSGSGATRRPRSASPPLIRAAVEAPEAEGSRLTARGAGEVMASGDAIEGSTAFVEKREPVWKDPT